MFDLGWTELLVIGIVALIVVGPKDLPVLFKKGGEFVGRLKGMAREFSSAMNEAADDAGVSDINKTLKAATNPMQTGFDSVKDAASEFTKWTPETETGKLAAERAEAAKKIHEATAKRAQEKRDAETAAAAPAETAQTKPIPAASEPVAEAPKSAKDSG
ncbi:MAG: twin-arginine translocase subunit TatB [Rhodobacteraceae bacterium]|nr:twin-arginine translocase subunit TatB [Paracoccaceae bacterium]